MRFALLAATVIRVAFLDFGTDAVAAFGAAKKPSERLRLPLLLAGRPPPAPANDRLNLIERLLRDYRFVDALVNLSRIEEMAVIERISPFRLQSATSASANASR